MPFFFFFANSKTRWLIQSQKMSHETFNCWQSTIDDRDDEALVAGSYIHVQQAIKRTALIMGKSGRCLTTLCVRTSATAQGLLFEFIQWVRHSFPISCLHFLQIILSCAFRIQNLRSKLFGPSN